jgi:peptidoglycan/LPS O-acetylase OafA/YrhL
MDTNHIKSLTGLRFLSALWVFLFHIHIRYPLTDSSFLSAFLNYGHLGMILFFVLSGYILTHRYSEKAFELKSYYINRFARVFPIYILAGIVTLPWFIHAGVGNNIPIEIQNLDLKEIDNNALAIAYQFFKYAGLIFANVLAIQAWFPSMFDYWNVNASWSISVEAFFYLLFPFLLEKIIKLDKRRLIYLITSVYLISAIIGILIVFFGLSDIRTFYILPIFRLPEFCLGIGLYLLISYLNSNEKNKLRLFSYLTAAVFCLYIFLIKNIPNILVIHNWIAIPFIVAIIFIFSQQNLWLAKIFSNAILVFFGKISYCFYSFQALVLFTIGSNHNEIIKFFPVLENNLILALTSFIALTLISSFAFLLIEEPARKYLKKNLIRNEIK